MTDTSSDTSSVLSSEYSSDAEFGVNPSFMYSESELSPPNAALSVNSKTKSEIGDFFAAYMDEINEKGEKHQKIITELYTLLAYRESGFIPPRVLRAACEYGAYNGDTNALLEFASTLFEQILAQANERLAESERLHLGWLYNGTRNSFVKWARLHYVQCFQEIRSFEDLKILFSDDSVDDVERYFHSIARKFYKGEYEPMVERMKNEAVAIHEQKKEELKSSSSYNKLRRSW